MYAFDTAQQAEAASNEMFKVKNPSGTTELLYGWMLVEGKYVLQGVDERFKKVGGKWAWVEQNAEA